MNNNDNSNRLSISGVWKKLPFKIKLIVIGVAGALFLLFIIIVTIISIAPIDHLTFSNETKTKISDNDDIKDYTEGYEDFYGEVCNEGDPGCAEENIEASEKVLKEQKKFYNKLNKVSKGLSSKGQNILLATTFYGYSMTEFSETGGAFINTDDAQDTSIDSNADAWKDAKKSLKSLSKKLKDNGEEGFYNYLIEDDYLDDKPVAKGAYASYAKLHGLDSDYSKWEPEDKQAVRKRMVEEIRSIVEEYEEYNGEKNATSNNTGVAGLEYLQMDLCPDGLVSDYGTVDLDTFVAYALKQEYGGIITNRPETAKLAAIAIRTYIYNASEHCTKSFANSQRQITYTKASPDDPSDAAYFEAANATSGAVFVNESNNIAGGQFVSVPISQYREETSLNGQAAWTFHMQGLADDDRTNYDYTVEQEKIRSVAREVGGIAWPGEGSGHHWGVSQYAIGVMGDEGMDFKSMFAETYGTGNVLRMVSTKGVAYDGNVPGLQIISSEYGQFIARLDSAVQSDNNPYYDFGNKYYGECAWYARYRAKEIIATMGYTETDAVRNADYNGGNGGDYCYSEAYKDYKHYWNIDEPGALKPGNLISWDTDNPGGYGHVAVIENVQGDQVTISEAWASNSGPGHQSRSTYNKSGLATKGGNSYYNYLHCTIDLSEVDNGASYKSRR